jgi:hypothetical protein
VTLFQLFARLVRGVWYQPARDVCALKDFCLGSSVFLSLVRGLSLSAWRRTSRVSQPFAAIGVRTRPGSCGIVLTAYPPAERLTHATLLRDSLPFLRKECGQVLVPIDLSQLNVTEGDEAIQHDQRGVLGAE